MIYIFYKSVFLLTILIGQKTAFAACESDQTDANQSFIIATDISSSMSEEQIDLQSKAYVNAFSHPSVTTKLLGCGCTEISVFFWGHSTHTMIQDLKIKDESDLEMVRALYADHINSGLPYDKLGDKGNTYIAQVMQAAIDHLSNDSLRSHNRGILISGDGTDSSDFRTDFDHFSKLRARAEYNGIQISGVSINEVIGSDFIGTPTLNTPALSPLKPISDMDRFNEISNPVTAFYNDHVITEFGKVYEASSFKDFEPALIKGLEEMACKPMF